MFVGFSFHALDVIGEFPFTYLCHALKNILAGDLAFGAPFRLLEKLRDNVVISASQTTAINALDTKDASFPSIEISPVKAANKRSEYTTCSAVWPMWVRHMLLHIPWFATRSRAMENIATLAVTALAKRLSEPLFRHDLLSQLLDGKNDGTLPLSNRELSAEVSTLLSAGSDTTSK